MWRVILLALIAAGICGIISNIFPFFAIVAKICLVIAGVLFLVQIAIWIFSMGG